MKKYKIGDIVKIKSTEEIYQMEDEYKCFPIPHWDPDMEEYCSKKVHIVSYCGNSKEWYRILEDGRCWYWADWMFKDDSIKQIEMDIE